MVRMQRVHRWTETGSLPTSTWVFWILAAQRRLVCLLEWLTLLPKVAVLPHSWQVPAKVAHPLQFGFLFVLSYGKHSRSQVFCR